MLCKPTASDAQQLSCQHCGKLIGSNGRGRRQKYCSGRCRQDAHRARRRAEALPQRPPENNAPAAGSAEIGVEKFNEINGANFVTRGPSAAPLNLLGGGGFRWPGAHTSERLTTIQAVVDAELGVVALVSQFGRSAS
jgi:hypothetical protein